MFCLSSRMHEGFFVDRSTFCDELIQDLQQQVGGGPGAESNVILRNAAPSINTSLLWPLTSHRSLLPFHLKTHSCAPVNMCCEPAAAVRTGDQHESFDFQIHGMKILWRWSGTDTKHVAGVHTPPSVSSFQIHHLILAKTCHLLPTMHQTTQFRDAEWATSCSLYLSYFPYNFCINLLETTVQNQWNNIFRGHKVGLF